MKSTDIIIGEAYAITKYEGEYYKKNAAKAIVTATKVTAPRSYRTRSIITNGVSLAYGDGTIEIVRPQRVICPWNDYTLMQQSWRDNEKRREEERDWAEKQRNEKVKKETEWAELAIAILQKTSHVGWEANRYYDGVGMALTSHFLLHLLQHPGEPYAGEPDEDSEENDIDILLPDADGSCSDEHDDFFNT